MIEKPPVERVMYLAEAEDASGAAGLRLGKKICVSLMTATKQWERNIN